MCTCCGRMLKSIRCVRNNLAGSSDVGFAGDRHRCRSLVITAIENDLATKKCIRNALFLSGS